MPIRIKMCGITRPEDAIAACKVGADAIGLVFYAPSKRAVSIEQAQSIVRHVSPYTSIVGLFVDANAEEVQHICAQVALDELQFHGNEAPDYCRQYRRRYSKAVPMNALHDTAAVNAYMANYPDAGGFLLDAFGNGQSGGSGSTFDWRHLPRSKHALIIAGGLNSSNIADLLNRCQPHAVDVSSGIESAPGIKDTAKMQAFVAAVRQHSRI